MPRLLGLCSRRSSKRCGHLSWFPSTGCLLRFDRDTSRAKAVMTARTAFTCSRFLSTTIGSCPFRFATSGSRASAIIHRIAGVSTITSSKRSEMALWHPLHALLRLPGLGQLLRQLSPSVSPHRGASRPPVDSWTNSDPRLRIIPTGNDIGAIVEHSPGA